MDLEQYLRNVGGAVLELSAKIERQAAARAVAQAPTPSKLAHRFVASPEDGRELRSR